MEPPNIYVFHTFLKENYETTTDMKDKVLYKDIFDEFHLWLEKKYGRSIPGKYGQTIIYAELKRLPECPSKYFRTRLCLTYIVKKSESPIAVNSQLNIPPTTQQSSPTDSAVISQSNTPLTNTLPIAQQSYPPNSGAVLSQPDIPSSAIVELITQQSQSPPPKPIVRLKIVPKVTQPVVQPQPIVQTQSYNNPTRPPPLRAPFGGIIGTPIVYPVLNKSKVPHV
jgi:hypothetical protein